MEAWDSCPVGPADFPMRDEPMSFSQRGSESRDFCAENSLLIVEVLKKLFTHQVSVKQLSGPVGIAVAAGQAAETKLLGCRNSALPPASA